MKQIYKMDAENQIKSLERQIAIKKIARQYNVTDHYVRSIIRGDRNPNKKSGILVAKALHEKNIL